MGHDKNQIIVPDRISGVAGGACPGPPFPEAPADGLQYGRQDLGWTVSAPEAPIDGQAYARQSAAWAVVPPGTFVDAPIDGNTYGREDGAWVVVPPSIEEAPIDGTPYARQDAGWVPTTATTILPGDALPIVDGVAVAGVSLAYSREDHVHPVTPGQMPSDDLPLVDGIADPGVSVLFARGDHVHPLAPGSQPGDALPIVDGVADAGVSLAFSREDHVHPLTPGSTFPGDAIPIIDGVGVAGVSLLYSREDHVHPASPGQVPSDDPPLIDSIANPGVSNLYARGDHVHPSDAPLPSDLVPIEESDPGDPGVSLEYSRADHIHPAPPNKPLPGDDLPLMDAIADPGTAMKYSRMDHVHPSDAPLPSDVIPLVNLDPGNPGISLLYSREDHVHPHDPTRIEEAPIDGIQYGRIDATWTPTIPEAPIDGSTYARRNALWEIVPTGFVDAPIDGQIYGRQDAGWQLIPPSIEEAPIDGTAYSRQDAGWIASTAFIDAPIDGTPYSRQDASWVPSTAFIDAPVDGVTYGRKDAAWEPLVDVVGVEYIPFVYDGATGIDFRTSTFVSFFAGSALGLHSGGPAELRSDSEVMISVTAAANSDPVMTFNGTGATMMVQKTLMLSKDPVVDLEAATKQYVDSVIIPDGPQDGFAYGRVMGVWEQVVKLAGDTMLGSLVLANDPLLPLEAATKQYVDTTILDYVPIAGGTMTGPLILAAAPIELMEATTKEYVDTLVASQVKYLGVWQVAANIPDISAGVLAGEYYIAATVDESIAEIVPPGIPGIAGLSVKYGDQVIWNSVLAQFEILSGTGMTMPEGDLRYLQLIGGTVTGPINSNSPIKIDNTSAGNSADEVLIIRNYQYPPPGTSPSFAIRCHDSNPGLKITSRITSHSYGGTFETDFFVGNKTSLPRVMLLKPGEVYVDGTLNAGNVINRSSEVLKRNIEEIPMDDVLEGWNGLNPRRYWLKDPGNHQARQIGFIAEELEANETLRFMVSGEEKEKGYDITQVLALTIARVKQLEEELIGLRRSV
jgi:hypothetical protein